MASPTSPSLLNLVSENFSNGNSPTFIALSAYLNGNDRHLSSLRHAVGTEPGRVTETDRLARALRTDDSQLTYPNELLTRITPALAEIRQIPESDISPWDSEIALLLLVVCGHLVRVQHEHGGRIRRGWIERDGSQVSVEAVAAEGAMDLAFVDLHARLHQGANPDAEKVTHGFVLAWPEQVADFFPGLIPNPLDLPLETLDLPEPQDTADEDEQAHLVSQDHRADTTDDSRL